MKISEMITELQKFQAQHGEIEVTIIDPRQIGLGNLASTEPHFILSGDEDMEKEYALPLGGEITESLKLPCWPGEPQRRSASLLPKRDKKFTSRKKKNTQNNKQEVKE
jgi:hypothetical protein